MNPLGQLDPRAQQEEQRRIQTAQSVRADQALADLLRGGGEHQEHQFTSPWQAAGQWAQTLAGKMAQGRANSGYQQLNALMAPGSTDTDNAPAATAAAPQGGSASFRFSPEVNQAIIEGSQAVGANPEVMARFARIESGGRPNESTGHYKGLMQLSDDEMARVSNGQGDVWNPKDSTMAAGRIMRENAAAFEKFTGRQATPFDLYMMHQQGPAGYLAHVSNPNAPAWQNMANTGEGRSKGDKWAQATITGNGGHISDTSGQFLQRWQEKWNHYDTGNHAAIDQHNGPVAPAGASAAATGNAQAGAVPAAAGAGSPASSLMERGQFIHPSALPKPAYDLQRIQQMSRAGLLSPQDAQQLYQQLQPQHVQFGGGHVIYDPQNPNAPQTYMPSMQTKQVKVGDVDVPVNFWIDSQGRQRSMQSAGGGSAPAPGGAGPGAATAGPATGLGAAIQSGDIDAMSRAGIQRQSDLEAGKETAKSSAATFRGVQGLGQTGAQVVPLAQTALKIVSDPNWRSGGLAETRLALSRLASSLNLPSDAQPREILRQARQTMMSAMQSGAKTMSSEVGEQARLFLSEIETMKGELPEEGSTPEGQRSGWAAVARRANHWSDNADKIEDWVDQQPGKLPHSGIHRELRRLEKNFSMFDQGTPAAAPAASMESRTIGGRTYFKRGGEWYAE